MNSVEYRNKIVDNATEDITFQNATENVSSKNDKINELIKGLINTLYKDLQETEKNRESKNLEKTKRRFLEVLSEYVESSSAFSAIFDKAKKDTLEYLKNGQISEDVRNAILEQIKTLLRDVFSKRTSSSQNAISITPSGEYLNQYARKILSNQKLISRVKQSLGQTIDGYNKAVSKNIINYLTGGKYNEMVEKARKQDIGRMQTLTKQVQKNKKKISVWKSLFKKSSWKGKYARTKTLLKFFTVKRVKLNKKGFLGLYNTYVYKQLIKRIEEFYVARETKGIPVKKIGLALLKNVGLGVISGIKKIFTFGFDMVKSAFKQVLRITKAVGDMGMSILKGFKNFLFTPPGAYIVGFFSGILYQGFIAPLFKKIRDFVSPLLKQWFGIDENEELTMNKLKIKIADKLAKEVGQKMEEKELSKLREADKLTGILDEVEHVLKNIDYMMNCGGMRREIGKKAGGAASTIGTITGAAIGSLFGPIGTWAGAAIGGAIGGFVSAYVNNFYNQLPDSQDEKSNRENLLRDMRSKWNGKGSKHHKVTGDITHRQTQILKQKIALNNTLNRKRSELDDVNRKLGKNPNDTKLQERARELSSQISAGEQQDKELDSLSADTFKEDQDYKTHLDNIERVEKILADPYSGKFFSDTITTGEGKFDNYQAFWNRIKDGGIPERSDNQSFGDTKIDNAIKYSMTNAMRHIRESAFRTALQLFKRQEIGYEDIPKVATTLLNRRQKEKFFNVLINGSWHNINYDEMKRIAKQYNGRTLVGKDAKGNEVNLGKYIGNTDYEDSMEEIDAMDENFTNDNITIAFFERICGKENGGLDLNGENLPYFFDIRREFFKILLGYVDNETGDIKLDNAQREKILGDLRKKLDELKKKYPIVVEDAAYTEELKEYRLGMFSEIQKEIVSGKIVFAQEMLKGIKPVSEAEKKQIEELNKQLNDLETKRVAVFSEKNDQVVLKEKSELTEKQKEKDEKRKTRNELQKKVDELEVTKNKLSGEVSAIKEKNRLLSVFFIVPDQKDNNPANDEADSWQRLQKNTSKYVNTIYNLHLGGYRQ